jgi:2-oxoglutarate dehydrogenase complex dehydrogenase (E1) component-like enzyme
VTAGALVFGVVKPGGSASAQENQAKRDQYEQALADKLGISVDQLDAAKNAARDQLIDDAVAAGKLTQEQADKLKSMDPSQRAALRDKLGHGAVTVLKDVFQAAADAIGVSPADLKTGLQSGQSLTDIAQAKGIDRATLKSKMTDILSKDITDAQNSGKITSEQAARLQKALGEHIDQVIDHKGGMPAAGERHFGGKGAPQGGPVQPAPKSN